MQGLQPIKEFVKKNGIKVFSPGIRDSLLSKFNNDRDLIEVVNRAANEHSILQKKHPNTIKMDEVNAMETLQRGYMQFYDVNAVNPYIALAAQGPWIVTAHGSVIYDTGGYGMLGFGHAPKNILDILAKPHVQANIMTPSFSQLTFKEALQREIGHTRPNKECPYPNFICLNSGSESVTLAMRIADADAKLMTKPDGPHPGRSSCIISLVGSFHGRTERPSFASDSTRNIYKLHLNSFSQLNIPLYTVEPNNIEHLKATFEEINAAGLHPEIMLMEPVMGEGNPGLSITREFYDAARKLCDDHRSLLLVDSIQAGLRARGVLSIMDYPGFQDASPPDFETYSKAINVGQFPMSVLALGPRVAEIYTRGLYGNTMTTNPRALEVATAVLESMTPELRSNIVEGGEYFINNLKKLHAKRPDIISKVSGTGLLSACYLHPTYKAYGTKDSLEYIARRNGLGVIHGGKNALRFTPNFTITQQEADLVMDLVDESIEELISKK